MKEFIYLDTNYITSALAQINQGSILSYTSEVSETADEQTSEQNITENETHLGLTALLNFMAKSKNQASDENIYKNSETAKDVITKTFDDYSFDILYQHINTSDKLKTTDYDEGDFILLTGEFKLVDFDFLLTLLDKDFVDMYIKNDLKASQENSNREERRGESLKTIEKETRKSYEETKKSVGTLRKLLPSNIMLQMEDVLAPINPKFLRGDFKDISFKYKKISVLARITRKFTYETYDGADILLNAVDYMLPNILKSINMDIANDSFIATPISIYIE